MKDSYMELSTLHIRPKAAKLLDDIAENPYDTQMDYPPVFKKGPYGYIIPVSPETISNFRIPDIDLSTIIRYTIGENCSYLMLDSEGEIVKGLPTYEKEWDDVKNTPEYLLTSALSACMELSKTGNSGYDRTDLAGAIDHIAGALSALGKGD